VKEPPCENPYTSEWPAPINYDVFFTNLHDSTVVRHYGTCIPTGDSLYPTDLRWIGYAPWAYYLYHNNGVIEILGTADWIEGPYTSNATLAKTQNRGLYRMLYNFAGEYRGSDGQRAEPDYWLQEAFPTQEFLMSQYHLAPNIGTDSHLGTIDTHYPLFRFGGSISLPAETLATHAQSSTDHHAYHAGFVLSAFLVTATKLDGSASLQLLDGDTPITSLEISGADADEEGKVHKLVVLTKFPTPNPLKIKLTTTAEFLDESGSIVVECTEILEQKPSYEDLFLVLRCGGARVAETPTDGSGKDENQSRLIGENYFRYGCITNVHGAAGLVDHFDGVVNTNAVFDSARRLSQCIRMIPRQQFTAYAVQDGKSILWFKRYVDLDGATIDMFKGIAPGAGEADGIRHVAPDEGWTNEWLMGVQLKAYKNLTNTPMGYNADHGVVAPTTLDYDPNNSSLWKPDAYSDYFAFSNRCLFYSPEIANDPALLSHTSFGNRVPGRFGGVLAPEAPSGWNYAPLSGYWLNNSRVNVNVLDCDPGAEGYADCVARRKRFSTPAASTNRTRKSSRRSPKWTAIPSSLRSPLRVACIILPTRRTASVRTWALGTRRPSTPRQPSNGRTRTRCENISCFLHLARTPIPLVPATTRSTARSRTSRTTLTARSIRHSFSPSLSHGRTRTLPPTPTRTQPTRH
jgi:hypothetical protein